MCSGLMRIKSIGGGDTLPDMESHLLYKQWLSKICTLLTSSFIKAWTPGFSQAVGQSFLVLEAEAEKFRQDSV